MCPRCRIQKTQSHASIQGVFYCEECTLELLPSELAVFPELTPAVNPQWQAEVWLAENCPQRQIPDFAAWNDYAAQVYQ